jgi:hypothetical protein
MAGYAATARIGRTDARIAIVADRPQAMPIVADAWRPTARRPALRVASPGRLFECARDQWQYARESIGQITFYLFDSESWR